MGHAANGLEEGQTSARSMKPSPSSLEEEGSLVATSQNARRVRRTRTMSLEAKHRTSAISYNYNSSSGTSTTPTLARPTSSRRSSIMRGACSRSSSFLIRPTNGTQPPRPHMPLRSSSAIHARAYSTNSSDLYAEYKPLFRSMEASGRNGAALSVEPHAHLTSTSLPTLISPTTIAEPTINQSSQTLPGAPEFEYPPSYSNHVPATPIDWTLPSTRRKQYDEIDKSCRGFRGLVRRLTLNLFRLHGKQVGFYDAERSSDVGTVRRYRMNDDDCDSDVDETENEKHCFGDGIIEKGRTEHLTGRKTREKWSCFNLGRRATTGKA
ncbi:hypothetical protein JMJ35_002179 [Cladonia borealis]|uniref:Uncharacterized protein n=1 Tax=Cladonia borealis TaxID=184061 RepID=A0AA39V992_9LECA|nr:hypothetical protein JMJ35_002179 [Cladonia borealis]